MRLLAGLLLTFVALPAIAAEPQRARRALPDWMAEWQRVRDIEDRAVATLPGKTLGFQLSRVRNAWGVGVVQKWWIRYAAFQKKASTMEFDAWQAERNQLLLEFPACTLQEGKPDGTTTAQSRDTTK